MQHEQPNCGARAKTLSASAIEQLAEGAHSLSFSQPSLSERLKEVGAQLAPASARARELEWQLAEANARALAQEQIGEPLRAYLDKIAAGSATAAAEKG